MPGPNYRTFFHLALGLDQALTNLIVGIVKGAVSAELHSIGWGKTMNSKASLQVY